MNAPSRECMGNNKQIYVLLLQVQVIFDFAIHFSIGASYFKKFYTVFQKNHKQYSASVLEQIHCSINNQMRNLPSITLGRALLTPLKCLGHSDPPSSASRNLFYPKTYRH